MPVDRLVGVFCYANSTEYIPTEWPSPLPLEKILFSQGFGTRRYCSDLVYADLVEINGVLADDPEIKMDPEGLVLRVEGIDWAYHEKAYIAFNKPANYECSHKTKHHPSVYSLLPRPLVERAVQCVGRLDQDTTGLLLLSDDGQFIHRMTTPKKNIGKVYEITAAEPITPKANRPFTGRRCFRR